MDPVTSKPYLPQNAAQSKPLAGAAESGTNSVSAQKAAEKETADKAAQSAQKPAEQPARPTTNNQGQTIGARLNVTA